MINLTNIRVRKFKNPSKTKLARITLNENTCRELVWFWKPVQELLVSLNAHDKETNKRHGNYKEIYIETCLRPSFYSDIRKRFYGNKETMSCDKSFKLTYEQLTLLEGITNAVVFGHVRQKFYNSYEVVEITPSNIIISFSGIPHHGV